MRASFVAIAMLGLLVGCDRAPAAPRASLTVFASASLGPVFEAARSHFESTHPEISVSLHTAGTPQLVAQAREGAEVDVAAFADEASMRRLLEAGIVRGQPTIFAQNRLAILTQKGNPKAIRTPADLSRSDVLVGLCAPEVPAGRYAREALKKLQIELRPRTEEPNVRALTAKLRSGDLDAAIAYTTDAHGEAQIERIAIPEEANILARYPMAVTAGSKRAAEARAFLAFVTSSEGQRLLSDFGFLAP